MSMTPGKTHIRLGNGPHGITTYTAPARTAPPRVRAAAVSKVKVDPEVLATARRIAGGDDRRLTINPDGSVTLNNHPR